jgi:uncharacterized protein (TIGR02678 family)
LLRAPLLPALGETSEEYLLVRRHAEWLRDWFAKFPGWSLHVDKDVARLRKLPGDLQDDTRGAVDGISGTAFSRRRYALLCLTLAALEESSHQTTLRRIAQTIMDFGADPAFPSPSTAFDVANYDHRRDLVHAVRLLSDSGVLRRVDGDERHFLNRSASADVLYDINRPILAVVLNVSCSISALDTGAAPAGSFFAQTAALVDEPTTQSRLVRSLLDDPILHFDELPDNERQYFERHRGYLIRHVSDATGLAAEVRREGVAMVDDAGDLTDIKLPEEGTDGHLALLLVQWLGECARNVPGKPVPLAVVEEHVCSLIQIYGSRWRKDVREAGAEVRLTEEVLSLLRSLRLIRLNVGGVMPLAACARYAAPNSTVAAADDRREE